MFLVGDLFSLIIMVVDNEVFKVEAFDNEFMIGFYGGGWRFHQEGLVPWWLLHQTKLA